MAIYQGAVAGGVGGGDGVRPHRGIFEGRPGGRPCLVGVLLIFILYL